MSFSLIQVACILGLYLLALFVLASITEKRLLPTKLLNHPLMHVLSMGTFITAWAFFGMLDLIAQYGYSALTYYIGVGAVFVLSPLLLAPLLRLCRLHQLHTLADILTFRFFSNATGMITSLGLTLAMIPFLALQIKSVADTVIILRLYTDWQGSFEEEVLIHINDSLLPIAYCIVVAAFTMLFGTTRQSRQGMVPVMAFDTLLKLSALLGIGGLALFGVFEGNEGLNLWLKNNPQIMQAMNNPTYDATANILLLVCFGVTLGMPQLYQIASASLPIERSLHTLSWGTLILLLLAALPTLPILWAGLKLGVPLPPEYLPLGLPIFVDNHLLTILAFLGGLAAATSAIVLFTLSLATMLLNHWLTPFIRLDNTPNLYLWLADLRRLLIAGIIVSSYLFYHWAPEDISLSKLGLTAFVGVCQLLPAIFAVPYWAKGNATGVIAGISGGLLVWFFGLFLPLLNHLAEFTIAGITIPLGTEQWPNIALLSLTVNCLLFTAISLLVPSSEKQKEMASLCTLNDIDSPMRLELGVHSPNDFVENLTPSLGLKSAQKEVLRALRELKLPHDEHRPYALRKLREQILTNLSGLMGPAAAYNIIEKHIPYHIPKGSHSSDIRFIESRLEEYRSQMTGMSAELDALRRHHRQTLENLPLGACSIGPDREVLMWNRAMEDFTQLEAESVIGARIEDTPAPWGELLSNFLENPAPHISKQQLNHNGQSHWVSLHKAHINSSDSHPGSNNSSSNRSNINASGGEVILLEDFTDTQVLEQELIHSERLASIGRLAAGVAHEIGNPVTGIACLTQNLQYDIDNPEVQESSNLILEQTERIRRILHSLLNFAHRGKENNTLEERVRTPISQSVSDAMQLLRLQKEAKEVSYSNEVPDHLQVTGDPQQLVQVFINLLGNARDASEPGSAVTVTAVEDEQDLYLRVIDQGSGIPEDIKDQVFEPFFTTKDPDKGTGLGLSLVYSIISEHGGNIEIQSPVDPITGKGTAFVIRLPKAKEAPIK